MKNAFIFWHRRCSPTTTPDVFTTIRRYRVKLGQADQAIRLAEVELVPIIRAIPGFVSYQALVVGPQSIVSVSTYNDRNAAESANVAAAEWVELRVASMMDGPGKVTVGEIRISTSADEHASANAAA